MPQTSNNTTIVSGKVNSDKRAILETAAELAHINLKDFMRRGSPESVETEVLNRTIITIPAKDWEALDAWLNRPAEPNPALAELVRRTPAWEKLAGVTSPRPLAESDDRNQFDCGRESPNSWFRGHAWAKQVSGASRVNVMTHTSSGQIGGHVTLSAAEIERAFPP